VSWAKPYTDEEMTSLRTKFVPLTALQADRFIATIEARDEALREALREALDMLERWHAGFPPSTESYYAVRDYLRLASPESESR
jgi:hypothetical protein